MKNSTYWNTRIIKHIVESRFANGNVLIGAYYAVHEVYYDDKNNPVAWTQDEIGVRFESPDDLQGLLEHIEEAKAHSVLLLKTKYNEKDNETEQGKLIDTGMKLEELMQLDEDIEAEAEQWETKEQSQ